MLGNNGLSIFGNTQTEDTLMALAGMGAGRTYYVNNITGATANDGLSWNSAFAQVSEAVSASEAFRKLGGGAPLVTTNDYVRNTIVIQGIGAVYTALTALPNYTDVIGLGAVANGHGAGIARIGGNGADGIAGAAYGLNLYNLQFQSGGDFYCMDFTNLLRSSITNCALSAAADSTTGGIRFSSSSDGNRIAHNHWGRQTQHGHFLTGIQIDGPGFNHNIIEDNFIEGFLLGIKVDTTVTQAGWTIVRNNVIGSIAGKGCACGIDDRTLFVTAEYGKSHIIYVNNFITARTAFQNTQSTQKIGNMKDGSATPFSINL